MKNMLVEEYYNWFNTYVKEFSGKDSVVNQNIEHKRNHTLNVAKHTVNIAKSLNLTDKEVNTAEIIGLFHDIGRFEQFRTYKTFRDYLSVNHAGLGVRILEENKILQDLDENRQNIIIKAISLHNAKELPSDLNEEEVLFCKLIRDADKLDIFRVIIEYEKESINHPDLAMNDFPISSGYNKELVKDILLNKRISNDSLKNFNDKKLYALSWISDLNFPYSFNYLKEKEILKKLVDCLPKDDKVNKIYEYLEQYIENFSSINLTLQN